MTPSVYTLDDPGARTRYHEIWEGVRGVFASLRYADAASAIFGLKAKICLDAEDSALLMHLKGAGPVQRMVTPVCTQYSALLLPSPTPAHLVHRSESPLDRLLCCVESICRSADVLSPLEDPRPAQWRGWQVRPLFTYRTALPLNMSSWSQGTLRTWKTKQTDYEILEDPGSADQVIDLCAKSYKRHGRRLPAHPAALRRMTEAMGSWARVFVAVQKGIPEAGLIILHDEHTAHYWIAGSLPGPAMTVLIGDVLSRLSQSGIRMFDFVGANTPSIAEFKRTFGPVLTQYYHLRRRPRIYFGRR